MKARIFLAIVIAALFGAWAGWSVRDFMAVDACLDLGGRWERSGGFCDRSPTADTPPPASASHP